MPKKEWTGIACPKCNSKDRSWDYYRRYPADNTVITCNNCLTEYLAPRANMKPQDLIDIINGVDKTNLHRTLSSIFVQFDEWICVENFISCDKVLAAVDADKLPRPVTLCCLAASNRVKANLLHWYPLRSRMRARYWREGINPYTVANGIFDKE